MALLMKEAGCRLVTTGFESGNQEMLDRMHKGLDRIRQFSTEAFEWAKANGYLTTIDYSQWLTEDGHHNCVISLPGLPAEELVRLCDEALKDYHLRPAYLWMKLKQAVKQPGEGMRTLKSAVTFMKYLGRGAFDRERENIQPPN